MIPLKSENDLSQMRESGRILSRVLKGIRRSIKPGVSTYEVDALAEKLIAKEGALAAFKGYRGYPAALCISVNEEIVHGIPGKRKICDGDVVSIDCGVNLNGYFSDAALTVGVGDIGFWKRRLIAVARKALSIGISQARPGKRVSDISSSIQRYVEKNGFSVVRQFVGHGIGRSLHEEPEVPNFGKPGEGVILEPGMVLAIEPMVNMGTWESEVLENGWTAVTRDRLPSAHFEHTVAVTERGPLILTK